MISLYLEVSFGNDSEGPSEDIPQLLCALTLTISTISERYPCYESPQPVAAFQGITSFIAIVTHRSHGHSDGNMAFFRAYFKYLQSLRPSIFHGNSGAAACHGHGLAISIERYICGSRIHNMCYLPYTLPN